MYRKEDFDIQFNTDFRNRVYGNKPYRTSIIPKPPPASSYLSRFLIATILIFTYLFEQVSA
jgi:hypothetical protein